MTTNTEQLILREVMAMKETLGKLVENADNGKTQDKTVVIRLNNHTLRIRVLEAYSLIVFGSLITIGYFIKTILPLAAAFKAATR